MIANTRWMTATDLADRLEVTPSAVRNAYDTKGSCAGFKIQKRRVKPGEEFGRAQYVFRGLGGALKTSTAPVTDRPPEAKAESVASESPRPTTSTAKHGVDPTIWQTRDELATALGCKPKSVRNAWEKGSRINRHSIERRDLKAGEARGRAKFLYRGVVKGEEVKPVETSSLRWMRISELASQLGVHPNSLRISAERGTRTKGNHIARREVEPGEVSNGRVKYLFAIVPKDGASADADNAAAPTSGSPTDAPSEWMTCIDLAETLGVHHNAVRFACDKGHKCKGFAITRRRVVPSDKVSGRTSYMYRAEAGGPTENLGKAASRVDDVVASAAVESFKPEKTPGAEAPLAPKVVAAPAPSDVSPEAATSVATMLDHAAQHCQANPSDAAAILRFLSSWVANSATR